MTRIYAEQENIEDAVMAKAVQQGNNKVWQNFRDGFVELSGGIEPGRPPRCFSGLTEESAISTIPSRDYLRIPHKQKWESDERNRLIPISISRSLAVCIEKSYRLRAGLQLRLSSGIYW